MAFSHSVRLCQYMTPLLMYLVSLPIIVLVRRGRLPIKVHFVGTPYDSFLLFYYENLKAGAEL